MPRLTTLVTWAVLAVGIVHILILANHTSHREAELAEFVNFERPRPPGFRPREETASPAPSPDPSFIFINGPKKYLSLAGAIDKNAKALAAEAGLESAEQRSGRSAQPERKQPVEVDFVRGQGSGGGGQWKRPGADIDDIVDPMVRRADAGDLRDVVPVLCNTTKGPLEIEVFPDSWGSIGAARFLDLVDAGLFETHVPLTRAVKGFIIQFGTPGDPAWNKAHKSEFKAIPDDKQWLPVGPSCGAKARLRKNKCVRHRKGFLSFAGGGENSRRIEMFVSLADTGHGGPPHEVPFGRVLPSSFLVLDKLHTGYGEMKSFGGKAPPSSRIAREGVAFLREDFPLLDYILACDRQHHEWEHNYPPPVVKLPSR
mmetsp:Transcript_32420/g.73285  ORF Transcript_32420/g.73285 Transcript_32420/m.73285 type:complete len:370 (-) Transcript_32420:162-1271(-)